MFFPKDPTAVGVGAYKELTTSNNRNDCQKLFRYSNYPTSISKANYKFGFSHLKIYFEAAHFSFNAEPKPVQLAHYQSKRKREEKKEKKKKHCLNKVATFNVTKSSTAKIPQAEN